MFAPKVASSLHLDEPWALLTFTDPQTSSLKDLDVARVLSVYPETKAAFKSSNTQFVIPWGKKNKGKKHCLEHMFFWFVKLIQKAFLGESHGASFSGERSLHEGSSSILGSANKNNLQSSLLVIATHLPVAVPSGPMCPYN